MRMRAQAMMQGLDPRHAQFLGIQVRRSNILGDALAQIAARRRELRKPLRVAFVSGGVPEEGVDQARACFDARLFWRAPACALLHCPCCR
jgi:hypothetical protein